MGNKVARVQVKRSCHCNKVRECFSYPGHIPAPGREATKTPSELTPLQQASCLVEQKYTLRSFIDVALNRLLHIALCYCYATWSLFHFVVTFLVFSYGSKLCSCSYFDQSMHIFVLLFACAILGYARTLLRFSSDI